MSTTARDLPYRRNVGIMLVNPAGQAFVGQRVDSPAPAWQMPQGGIDKGEDPLGAALRELMEETGVAPSLVRIEAEMPDWLTYDLPPEIQPTIWGGKYRGQQQRWFLMRFLGSDSDIDISGPPREFSEWRWLAPAELPGQIVPFKRAVYEAVLQAFAGPLGL